MEVDWKKLMPHLVVDKEDEKTFKNYINYKGIYLHLQIYDVLQTIELKCNYKLVSSIIRYDKGIRNVLYKYLSAFEERYRAILYDNFDVQSPISNPEKARIDKLELFRKKSTLSNLYDISYSRNFTLNVLNDTLKKYELIDKVVFDDFKIISTLRNKTMHHNLLMTSYHRDIEKVEEEINRIEDSIELLYKYLPEGMNKSFEKDINRCNNIGTKINVPNLKIICLREMRNGVFIQKKAKKTQ